MKIKAIVKYIGKNYYGWQKQLNFITIQEEIEKVISKILNVETSITGSGRTDAGVHALGQVFTFEVNKTIDINRLRYSINCLLNDDIHVVSLTPVDESFHARYSVKSKHYVYRIKQGENDPFDNVFTYNYLGHLDIDKMNDALKLFIGKHCFQSFTSKESDEDNFIREIFDIYLEQKDDVTCVHFIGEGFMRYMIRFMIGTAIAIAEQRETLDYIKLRLEDSKRQIVNYKSPSCGLTLVEVEY